MSTSRTVAYNPGLFESSIESLIRLTNDGLIVWRISRHNQNRFEAFPSDKIETIEDFELRVGRRLAGATVGYPTDVEIDDRYLWLRITDGAREQHYVHYHDAPTIEIKALVKELHNLAKEESGKGALSSLVRHD